VPKGPKWEMSERESGWLEGLGFSLSAAAEFPVFRSRGPWRLRREDAVAEAGFQSNHSHDYIAERSVFFDEIAAVDLERMSVQLVSEVEDSLLARDLADIGLLERADELIMRASGRMAQSQTEWDWKNSAQHWRDEYHKLLNLMKSAA
jgi:hypothetical protein